MVYDAIVIGSGIGGLSAAAVLAKAGRSVLVLEANYLPGGCCSSYWRKGWVFETGATTLMGLDPGQPLDLLASRLSPQFRQELEDYLITLNPAMAVWLDGDVLLRYQDHEQWVQEAIRVFGNAHAQRQFWTLARQLSDFVWKVSSRNLRFPPTSLADVLQLALRNSPADFPKLRYAFQTVGHVLRRLGLDKDQRFCRFLNEQLMITAQNTFDRVPMLFAAPALCYTNYRNFNPVGGMIQLPWLLLREIGRYRGDVRLRTRVTAVEATASGYTVTDQKGRQWQARQVLSNLPIWNLPEITKGTLRQRFQRQAQPLDSYWSAFTMGVVVKDVFPADFPLHHQLHMPAGASIGELGSHSIFISFSAKGDTNRAPAGQRVLAISTHAQKPGGWFQKGEQYYPDKEKVTEAILNLLLSTWNNLRPDHILYRTESTPVSWQQWTLRHEGTVGGLPQDISRPLYRWLGATSSGQPGFFLCGDTVYPGQGVPGVALGGIIAADRMLAS